MNSGMKIQMNGCRIIQIKNCLYSCKTAKINILRNIGTFQHWNIGKLVNSNIVILGYWEIPILVHWNFGKIKRTSIGIIG